MIRQLAKIVIGFLFICPLLLPTVAETKNNQRWVLEIGLSKEKYLLREPVWMDVTLTNVSQDTLRSWLGPPCFGMFHIHVKDSLGKELPYTGVMLDGVWTEGFLMAAGEQLYDCLNLLDYFAGNRIAFWFGKFPLGEYSVTATYRTEHSNELRFEVVEPAGSEEEAYRIILEAFSVRSMYPDSTAPLLQKLLEEYPESIYAERALQKLDQGQNLLKRFPNSGFCSNSLRSLTRGMADDEKRNYLNEVKETFTGTRAAKFAEQMLMMLEKEADKDTTEQEMRE